MIVHCSMLHCINTTLRYCFHSITFECCQRLGTPKGVDVEGLYPSTPLGILVFSIPILLYYAHLGLTSWAVSCGPYYVFNWASNYCDEND